MRWLITCCCSSCCYLCVRILFSSSSCVKVTYTFHYFFRVRRARHLRRRKCIWIIIIFTLQQRNIFIRHAAQQLQSERTRLHHLTYPSKYISRNYFVSAKAKHSHRTRNHILAARSVGWSPRYSLFRSLHQLISVY